MTWVSVQHHLSWVGCGVAVGCLEGPCGLCTCEKGVEGPGSNALAEGTKGQWVLRRVPCLEARMQSLVGCPCRGGSVRSRGEAGTRRGGHRAWSGRVVASLAAGGQAAAWEHFPRALQHPGKVGSSLGKGVELPTCSPAVFASSCLASACFPQGSSCSPARSLSLKPWGHQTLVHLGLACPQPHNEPSHCCPELAPHSLELPQQHTSIHPVLFEAL